MARSDLIVFEESALQLGNGEHDLSNNVLKLGIIDATITPAADDATATWGDYSENEVATTGNYPAGGITLANVTFTEAGGVATLDADDVALIQQAGGFTDGYWGIIYDDTNATDMALCFIDLGGPISEVDSPIDFTWNPSGIMTVTVNNA